MKSLIYIKNALVLLVLLVMGCDKESVSKTSDFEDKFNDFEIATKLHSHLLAQFYTEKVLPNANTTRAAKNDIFSRENIEEWSLDAVNSEIKKGDVLLRFAEKYKLEKPQTRSGDVSPQIKNFIDNAILELDSLYNYELIKNKIEDLYTRSTLMFSEAEQNHILFMFAIYLDSFCYWQENIELWNVALENELPQTRGFITPQERAMIRDAASCKCARSDMYGACTGGVGALLCAPTPMSFAVGWLWGAITASIYDAV